MPPRTRLALALLLVLAFPPAANAQHPGGGSAPRAVTAPREATQFDFLVGQWELTVRPKVSSLAAKIHGAPRLKGTWSAWRAFDGWGIEDEMRIVDASGNPMLLAHALRIYDGSARQWSMTLLDVYRTHFGTSTGRWNGTVMLVTARGTDAEGHPTLTRTRFFDITPTTFRFQQDKSQDDGRTWDEGTLAIEAKRVAAVAPR